MVGTTLYKYRVYSARALEMLTRRELYFAEPHSLNDPYDCLINIRQSLSAAIQGAENSRSQQLQAKLKRFTDIGEVYEKMNDDLASLGILSLAKNPTSALMWSHYAENHRGFCAGFRLSDTFTTHNTERQIVGTIGASYTASNPFVEYFNEIARDAKRPTWEEFWMTLLSLGMVTKAKTWEYEEEVRVIRREPGGVGFAPTELSEIVFGLNMPESNREALRKILSGSQWRHVRFREIVKSDGFELLLKDVNPEGA